MLTVSSRMKTDTGRRARIGMLTLDDASPLPRAHQNGAEHLAVVEITSWGCPVSVGR
jgi:hypothetical protein